MHKSKQKSPQELRKFGLIMAAALAVIGIILLWRGNSFWPYCFYISSVFTIFGLVYPRLLMSLEWGWMKLAYMMGFIMTHIILTLFFYLAITPMGLIMRIFSKNTLSLKADKIRKTYWIPVDPDGSAGRPDKPY